MSLLSAAHYSNVCQALSFLKSQFQEQNNQEISKFQLLGIKVKLIQEQTQEAKQSMDKYQRQTNSKIDNFSSSAKYALKSLLQSHPKNGGFNELDQQLKELQNCRQKLLKSNKNLTTQLQQKLQTQIDNLQKKINLQSQEHNHELKQIQNDFKKELTSIRNKIKYNEQLIESNKRQEKVEEISMKINKEIQRVRNKRIQRKQNFLNLLETIVVKCKRDTTQE